jgi:hypothetical protein
MPSLDVRRCGSSRAHSFGLRAVSAVLLAFFLLPVLIPFFNPGSESTVPACCRRIGKHHCAMSAHFQQSVLSASSEPVVGAVTPFCPYHSRLLMPLVSRVLFVPSAPIFSVPAVSHPALGHETILLAPLFEFRSPLQRGPPSLLA